MYKLIEYGAALFAVSLVLGAIASWSYPVVLWYVIPGYIVLVCGMLYAIAYAFASVLGLFGTVLTKTTGWDR